MLPDRESKVLDYNKNNTRKGVLGTLEGICADTIESTRNGRKYPQSLWEKVFKDPIVEELFKAGGIFGELGHPEDRQETDMEKIAICMPEPPKKNKDGKLFGRWDILDTPNGRILKCLCDYGYKIGISSRGSGDIIEDYDGTESVDPDTYHFEAFDAVLLPAVKAARLNLVEGLNKSLNEALTEEINKSDDKDKKIILETLDNLKIKYEATNTISDDIKVDNSNKEVDVIKSDVLESLQEALKRNRELEQQIADLHEKLSVSYAKESELCNLNEKYKHTIISLSDTSKSAKVLKEQLAKSVSEIEKKDKKIDELNSLLKENRQSVRKQSKRLNEDIDAKNILIEDLKNEVESLNSSCNKLKEESASLKESFDKEIASKEKNHEILKKRLQEQLSNSKALNKKYKTIARDAVNRYIESQATILGTDTNSIKSRLPEHYSFNDIDNVCEDLKNYRLNVSKLPFTLDSIKRSKIQINESKNQPMIVNEDDEVDNQLLNLAKLN